MNKNDVKTKCKYKTDEFHFFEVHGSMNTTAPMHSGRHLLCVHTSMNLRKITEKYDKDKFYFKSESINSITLAMYSYLPT